MTRRVPAPDRAISERLAAAGFHWTKDKRYERAHDRDPSYVIRVYAAQTLIRVEAVHCVGQGECDVFRGGYVDRMGPVETVLDRVIETAREAYATINRHRRGGNPTVESNRRR